MTNILTRDARAGLLAGRERPVRPGLVLAVVLIGQFMAVLDASIVNVAAPSIHASLRASGAIRSRRLRKNAASSCRLSAVSVMVALPSRPSPSTPGRYVHPAHPPRGLPGGVSTRITSVLVPG